MMLNRSLLGVASRHRRLLILTVGLQLLVVASFLPQAWALAHGLAAMVDGDPDGVLRALMVILALVAVRFLLTWRQATAAARLGVAVRVDLRDQALVGALVPAALHDPRRRDGALRATLVDGVDGVDAYVTRYLPAVAEVIVMSPVAVLFVTLVHPIAGGAAGLAVTASVLLPMLWKRAMSRRSLGHWDSYERLSSDLLEALRGMTTLRVLGQVGQARIRIAERSEQLHRATVRVMRTSLFSTALIDLAIQGGSLAAVVLAVVQVGSGQAGATTAYLVLLLAVEVFRPVRDLSRAWHAGYLGTTAVGALEGLGVGARRASEGRTTAPVAGDVPDRAPIELDGVGFRYPGSPAPVLDRVCATFPEGRVTAVVGSSGAGKSTLLDLVLGHLTPDHGRIHRAGQPLRSDDIAVITQRPLLFEGTVRDNVRVGRPEASDKEILRACAAAGILEEVTSMPAGLDSRVAAAGASLSGGQRQRLAIARAVVANRPVLLADEPTSALDPAAARAVTRTLAQLARDRIVIVVAHREESLEGVSRVLELREGSLLTRDTEEVTA